MTRMLSCYIIDDEPLAVDVIEMHAMAYGQLVVEGSFGDAVQAFRAIGERPVDVIFLDIEMPQLSGLDLVRSLPDPPLVVLTTAHRQYAVDGFILDAVDYLVKPVRFERFVQAMGRVERRMEGIFEERAATDAGSGQITVVVDRRSVAVPISEIQWVESRRDRIEIHMVSRTLSTYMSLSELTDRLEPCGLIRIHRSFAVNRRRIESRSAREVIVAGTSLPVGRTYRRAVMKALDA